ncbi:MAG TPA: N-acetylmuramoyl-L-alanine amidase [Candidatus Accumulibacter phosphatis]|nr:MAG: N-acetylmuramoyl-L-alanine amidase AmiD precursor [Candidatus Accumulibacter sp. SK-11]HRL78267.1 N-acetylmuramoyl-L-alanine amidase [Candidatus Accumulibacter phosphatis]HRQ97116.1 N-acetylmuramoyl-L-alanine amidase [Candidatus Accumulibacter phosphatis]
MSVCLRRPACVPWRTRERPPPVVRRLACLGVAVTILAGCGSVPAGPAAGIVPVPSPNHNARRPNYVILHDTTSSNVEHALRTLTDPARAVSSHYLIGRDGTLYQLVDEDRRAWHAGVSYWGGNGDLNSASIGIELDNTGAEPYPEAQIERLLQLLSDLRERYRIPARNVLGHGDVAPGRKVDPGRDFPWQRLATAGFGLWCHEQPPGQELVPVEPSLALQAIGYDVTDPAAALTAFRRHFLGSDMAGEASLAERQLMHCLLIEKRRTTPP